MDTLGTLSPDLGVYGGVIATTVEPLRIPRSFRLSKSTRGSRQSSIDRETDGNKNSVGMMVITIIITLIIFVTVISYYDLLREKIVYDHTKKLSSDPDVVKTPSERRRLLTIAAETYQSSIDFAAVVTVMAVIMLPILFVIQSRL
jgi:Na+/alanine symporter